MVNNLISFVAALCLGLAKPANSFALIIIGRFLIGVFAGEWQSRQRRPYHFLSNNYSLNTCHIT